jgi:phosphoserine phosphatase RsbU/P
MGARSFQTQSGARATLGLLVDWLEDGYQNSVLTGVADAARRSDVNLICFAGGVLSSPHRSGVQRNAVYELAGPENVDGLILMSGALGNHIGEDALARYCDRYRPLPMCSIAVALPGIPSVLVDNATGMRAALVHLIETHGCRRVAFIRGPAANAEAERRYRVYREVLAERGLPFEPDLVVVGDFQRRSGVEAIRLLVDERGAAFDAVAAASDAMALGVIDALRARGRRVPEEIAVVGFDDVEEARFAAPALTTVRQPLREQGELAVEILLALRRGEPIAEQITLSTELVTRRSCGCSARTLGLAPASSSGDFLTAFAAQRADTLADLTRAGRTSLANLEAGWAPRLLDAFTIELLGGPRGSFSARFEEILRAVIAAGGDVGAWQDVLTALRRRVLPCLAGDAELRAHAEDLWHELRVVIGEAAESAQAQHRLAVQGWARRLSEASKELVTAEGVVAMVEAVAEHFPRLSIPSAFLSLYEPGAAPAETSRLLLAYDATRPAEPASGERRFSSRELAPPGALPRGRRATFVLEPLFFQEEQLGFVLLEVGPREGAVYEALRDQLSAALMATSLMQRIVEKDRERERLLSDLEKRAGELERANLAIRENQEKLVTSEKLASLGRLTASIVHEMNSPLGAVRAALVEVGTRVNEYHASAGDPEVTTEDHRAIAGEMRRAIALAAGAAERAALFVRGIKSQTRDLGPHERLPFNVVTCVREALLLLGHALRKGNCRAIFEPPSAQAELHGSPVRLGQVVTNLVENAIYASLPGGGGAVTLTLVQRSDALDLAVADAGTGIDPQIAARIFEPMFTTKPFGQGTGLGLSIVHDIVISDFGGTVRVDSRPGLGTTFTVSFPRLAER